MKEKVKELRKTLGLTMEKFGERLGVKKQTVSRIENGVNNLTDQMIKAICNVNWDGKYVNEDWLRGNSPEMFRKEPAGELEALAEKYNLSNMEYLFLREYFKLSPSVRENFFETLDLLFSSIHETVPSVQTIPDTNTTVSKSESNLEELSDEEIGRLYREAKQSEKEAEVRSEVS